MYYIPVLILGTLPWSAYLWKVLRTDRLRTEPFFEKSDARLLWVWSLFILIFFSVSSSKLIPYVAPIFPPLAVVFGRLFRFHEDHLFKADICSGKSRLYALPVFLQTLIFVIALLLPLMLSGTKWGGKLDYLNLNTWWILITVPILAQLSLLFIPGLVQRRWKKGWFVTIYLSAVLFYASSMIPASHFLAPYKSAYPLVQAIRKLGLEDRTIYQYKSSLYGLGFYQNLRTPIVENIGEMEYGVNLLPPNEKDRYFLSADAFYRLCREKGDLFCVTKYERKLNELKKNVPNVEVLWDNGAYYILHIP
jgi:4-amino-4-deoxy-L-arabinose transferase-like glycosyltransferase